MTPRNLFVDNTPKGGNCFHYRRDWENQDVTQINREQSHSPMGRLRDRRTGPALRPGQLRQRPLP